jgi:mycofactocin system glycosyltransferase
VSVKDIARRAAPRGPLPAGLRLVLDPAVRRVDGRRVLIGGAPLRIIRLTEAGSRLLDRWTSAEALGPADGAQRLARRLLDGGLVHPRLEGVTPPFGPSDVAVVIPIHGRPDGLAATLAAVSAAAPGAVVVVDDGSSPPDAAAIQQVLAAVRTEHRAPDPGATAADPDPQSEAAAGSPGPLRLVRIELNSGPAAARRTGAGATDQPVLAFVDADVVPEPGWLDRLLAHLADPAVAAVAPRVRADPPATLTAAVAAYERLRSSLDRGAVEAAVRPRSRVSYVPAAALLVRREALDGAGGFDPGLRFGEDVDLVWRLDATGWTVRYDPSVTATHPARPTLAAWLRQRFAYGRSAAPLAARHGGQVAPLTVSGWSAAAWALIGAGAPASGIGLMAGTTAALVPKLSSLDRPVVEAARLAGLGNLFAGRQVASALRRAWFPLLGAMLLARRTRPAAIAALVVPPILDRRESGARSPSLPLWAAISLADDLSYGAGLWVGVWERRHDRGVWRALLPAFAGRFPPPDPDG